MAENKADGMGELAEKIGPRMNAAKDQEFWHAALCAAIDAGQTIDDAMDTADAVSSAAKDS